MTQIIKVTEPILKIVERPNQSTLIVQTAPVQINGGGISVDKFVFGEIPSGSINGSNATFTAANQFVPESLVVKVNGITQKLVNDYTVSGGLTISLVVSPVVGDTILINYIKV